MWKIIQNSKIMVHNFCNVFFISCCVAENLHTSYTHQHNPHTPTNPSCTPAEYTVHTPTQPTHINTTYTHQHSPLRQQVTNNKERLCIPYTGCVMCVCVPTVPVCVCVSVCVSAREVACCCEGRAEESFITLSQGFSIERSPSCHPLSPLLPSTCRGRTAGTQMCLMKDKFFHRTQKVENTRVHVQMKKVL